MLNDKQVMQIDDNENTMPEWMSFYFMKCALILHYKQKYPEHETLITEICELVGKLLGAHEPTGGGGVGMLRGWVEYIDEIENTELK